MPSAINASRETPCPSKAQGVSIRAAGADNPVRLNNVSARMPATIGLVSTTLTPFPRLRLWSAAIAEINHFGKRLAHWREKWFEQVHAMDEGLSVRKSAARMAVHRTTAFRWRHRFLSPPREVKAHRLSGIAQRDETYVLRSYKGQQRRLLAEAARKPRHHGGKAAKHGLSAEQVPILVLRNHTGQSTDSVLEASNKPSVTETLKPALAEDALLCTEAAACWPRRPRSWALSITP
jgi:hypothetical protein